jgi:dTDP-4-amino-4,6-dideoxygalactose transaminase
VLLCGSGTEALGLALAAAEQLLGETRTVALPAFSCFDVAAAAARFGRPVRFYDVDPATLGPVPESLAAAVRAGVGTVVIAPLFGVPVDWDRLDPLLRNVIVVEDGAQGHGGRWRGVRIGAHGRLGVLSFARGKGWTGGAGGALLVREVGDMATPLGPALETSAGSDLGILVRAGAHRVLGRPGLYRIPRSLPLLGLGETRYHPARAPRGMPASAAALLLDSWPTAEQEVATRRRLAAEYRAGLERVGIAQIDAPNGGEPGYVRWPVVVEGGMRGFREPDRAESLGAASSYPAPLPDLPAMRPLAQDRGLAWPGAARLAAELVTLPTHPLVRADERKELIDLLDRSPRRF